MRLLSGVILTACLLAAGCTTVDKTDPRPGGLAWTEMPAVSWLGDFSGNQARHKAWMFVRVMAPPGASECWGEKSMFDGVNPYPKSPVGADGAALVTVRNAQASSTFGCRTPAGVTRRTVASQRIVYSYPDYTGKKGVEHGYWAVPPLVHITPSDAQAAARWDALATELCAPGKVSVLCRETWLQQMKARDLGG